MGLKEQRKNDKLDSTGNDHPRKKEQHLIADKDVVAGSGAQRLLKSKGVRGKVAQEY